MINIFPRIVVTGPGQRETWKRKLVAKLVARSWASGYYTRTESFFPRERVWKSTKVPGRQGVRLIGANPIQSMYLQITSRAIGVLYSYIEFKSHRFSAVSRSRRNETRCIVCSKNFQRFPSSFFFFCFSYKLRITCARAILFCLCISVRVCVCTTATYVPIDIGCRIINREERLKIS